MKIKKLELIFNTVSILTIFLCFYLIIVNFLQGLIFKGIMLFISLMLINISIFFIKEIIRN
jgi:hypothetical protein